jgi:hypothetical protein
MNASLKMVINTCPVIADKVGELEKGCIPRIPGGFFL